MKGTRGRNCLARHWLLLFFLTKMSLDTLFCLLKGWTRWKETNKRMTHRHCVSPQHDLFPFHSRDGKQFFRLLPLFNSAMPSPLLPRELLVLERRLAVWQQEEFCFLVCFEIDKMIMRKHPPAPVRAPSGRNLVLQFATPPRSCFKILKPPSTTKRLHSLAIQWKRRQE